MVRIMYAQNVFFNRIFVGPHPHRYFLKKIFLFPCYCTNKYDTLYGFFLALKDLVLLFLNGFNLVWPFDF